MRKSLSLLFSLLIFNYISAAQSPDWQWEKRMGSLYTDDGRSIAVDGFGNVYTTGGFQGMADFDPGSGVYNMFVSNFGGISNLFVSKLDATGNFVWAKSVGNEQNTATGLGIRLDHSGNIYVTGEYADTIDFDPDSIGVYNMIASGSSDVFLLKLDSSGAFIWAKQFDGPDFVESYGIDLDNDGNIYTVGAFSGTVDFDPDVNSIYSMTAASLHDIFICKTDSGGNFIWAKQISGTGVMGENVWISVDVNGNVYTTGWFEGTIDFDPGPGVFNLISAYIDIYISRLDSGGNFVWVKSFADSSAGGVGITVDNAGFVYCTGTFSGTVDFDPGPGVANLVDVGNVADVFLLKLNSNGEYVWAKRMGGPDADEGFSVATDADGNVYSTGLFTSTADFDPDSLASFLLYNASTHWWDVFVSKLDASGNFVWAKALTGPAHDWSTELVIGDSGLVYIVGSFKSPVLMFDSIPLVNTGASANDIWVAKLNSSLSTEVKSELSKDADFTIYPNPSSSSFVITTSHYAINSIKVFNILGEQIYSSPFLNNRLSKIDCTLFPPGIYFVQVQTETGSITQKLIKQ
jgi:hypothetical protein